MHAMYTGTAMFPTNTSIYMWRKITVYMPYVCSFSSITSTFQLAHFVHYNSPIII